ncbi:MFS transporter [Thermopolyspora sp. NPDC052614]|uniref:MFS transporter n=1 Tax=Thermopolyspora sp. NPDC052614 TaxID=3155682 RepID=UPI0034364AE6
MNQPGRPGMTVTSVQSPAPPVPATARSTLVVSCAALLLVLINYTVPAVTLPLTAAGLGAGVTGPVWILNGVTLGMAALLLIAGVIADDRGRRRTYLGGMALFAVASVAAAAAPGTAVFVTARVLQGAASAALLAAGLGAVGHAYPAGPERLKATGRYGAMLGLGILIGPFVASGVTAVAGWRGTYWLIAVAAVLLLVLGARLLPESRADRPRSLDLPGVVTLGLGLAALLTGITEGRLGWTRPIVPIALGLAAVLFLAFTLIERRRAEPMLDLSLLRRPLFAVASAGAFVVGLAVVGPMTFLPTVLQLAHGVTPFGTAVLSSVWSGASFLVALQARRVRLGGRALLALGMLLSAAGYLPLLGIGGHWSPPLTVLGLLIAGVGSGFINAALTHLSIESVPPSQGSMGAGANSTARYVGSALGIAAIASVAGLRGFADGVGITLLAGAALVALTALATFLVRRA